jgi:hypothetical protein
MLFANTDRGLTTSALLMAFLFASCFSCSSLPAFPVLVFGFGFDLAPSAALSLFLLTHSLAFFRMMVSLPGSKLSRNWSSVYAEFGALTAKVGSIWWKNLRPLSFLSPPWLGVAVFSNVIVSMALLGDMVLDIGGFAMFNGHVAPEVWSTANRAADRHQPLA